MGDAAEIKRALDVFVRGPNGGLIVTSSTLAAVHRDLIVGIASKHRLPAIYANRLASSFVEGLLSYISNHIDQVRRAAGYKSIGSSIGEKPADLPVQAPTKYELVINLKTAKALGLTIPSSLLSRADEVIE